MFGLSEDEKKEKKDKLAKEEEDSFWVGFVDTNVINHPIRRNYHRKMELADNFYKGEQYKAIDPESGAVMDVRVNRETRSISNQIKVFINVYTAKMLAGNPIPQFSAHSGNTEDFDNDVSHVCQDLCTVLNKKENFSRKNSADVKNAAILGFAVTKVYFDDEAGKNLSELYELDDVTATSDDEKDSKEKKDKKAPVFTGAVKRDYIDPLHFFPDQLATSDGNMRYATHRFPLPIDVAEEILDLPEGTLKADDKYEDTRYKKETTIVNDDYDTDESGEGTEIVYINDVYYRACRKYPKGKRVVVANGKVYINDDNPQGKELPFITLKLNAREDEFVGNSYAFDLIKPQRDLNKMNSMIMENAENMGFNKVYMNKHNNYGKWTSDANGIIEGESDIPPAILQAKPIPEYIFTGPDRIRISMQNQMNLQNVDFSQIPVRGTNSSGKVIGELKESSRVAFSDDIRDIKFYIEKINLKAVKLYQKHFDEDELVEIIGESKRDMIKKFKETTFNPTSFDTTIRIAEGFSQGPAEKFAQIMELVTSGVLDGPHRDLVLRSIDNNGNIDAITEDFLADEKKAKTNRDFVIAGENEEALVSQYDNHATHIDIFQKFIRSSEWAPLKVEIKQALDQYITIQKMHQLANAERDAAFAMAMQMKQQQGQMQGQGQQIQPAQIPGAQQRQQTIEAGQRGGNFAPPDFNRTPIMQNQNVV